MLRPDVGACALRPDPGLDPRPGPGSSRHPSQHPSHDPSQHPSHHPIHHPSRDPGQDEKSPGPTLDPTLRTCPRDATSRFAPALPPRDAAAGAALPAQAAARRAALVDRLAAAFFERHPRSLGVALGQGRVSGAPRHVDAVDVRQRGWWREAGLPRGAQEPPMLIVAVDLLDRLEPEPALALLWAVGEHAPPGTLLLADASGRGAPARTLADRAALARVHPRLRRDALHRPLEACGAAWRWRGRLAEVWRGLPRWALYEVGVDV